ncbi:8-amino-7-oxononanoate synthase [Mergibacter septicus]|uniref:8-amino-7-oxononanoate synthase n=1 Tax=Mergibacter septicus TaxID=221402 RepID=A0A8E3MFW4_9PAST|nr:8-amino-7-oxononanoate synthase [Mergibacter septicus]AWX15334.1 8-amino-7-oxononanoate synthase [Mergibacter septicus]QDJ14588.1 8-amino-7-oxononanoate synthase [Mergibacter septicus]UTU47978.1 8-amino-7-oxononanoate synthase [Mergibacter septicus]WMR96415.1 8-amino-7-oxononanoate synthase [Mergibacter septicus]
MVDLADFSQQLNKLKQQQQYRALPVLKQQGKYIERDGQLMLNLSSNDYLGLAADTQLQQRFLSQFGTNFPAFTSSSSRLLTGNFPFHTDLEQLLSARFGRPSLLFNSGYHANIGILPALANKKTLIIADKLVHASLIDGIKLSGAKFVRYRHNDYQHLQHILQHYRQQFQRVIIVTESLFSMDGDFADLPKLVQLKQQYAEDYSQILLYVDEAHAVGVYGDNGLGLAESYACLAEIDLLVGTFGKALASMGAYLVCDQIIKEYLINHMRPLIFSTALPPFNIAWSYFLFEQLPQLTQKRQYLANISQQLRQALLQKEGIQMPSQSCIIPYILGDNQRTLERAEYLQQQGYYCLPIRPPTVPQGTSRIRFSLTADLTENEMKDFITVLSEC